VRVSLAPPILTSNIFLARLNFIVFAFFLSLALSLITLLAHSLTHSLVCWVFILVFIIIRDYSFPHTKHMLPLFLHLLILFLFPSYASASASASASSCHPSSFYSSIPELANGKPTTRAGWESVLDQLHTLLESSHVTVPYTSTNTDVVSVVECNRVQYGTVWYSRGEYSTVL
jgi:hypothetical protein